MQYQTRAQVFRRTFENGGVLLTRLTNTYPGILPTSNTTTATPKQALAGQGNPSLVSSCARMVRFIVRAS
jgi:hypothetical protein